MFVIVASIGLETELSVLLFQGVVIFFLHCLRRENVRKVWIPNNPSKLFTTLSNSSAQENLKVTETRSKPIQDS